jgi:hypothetical protein
VESFSTGKMRTATRCKNYHLPGLGQKPPHRLRTSLGFVCDFCFGGRLEAENAKLYAFRAHN